MNDRINNIKNDGIICNDFIEMGFMIEIIEDTPINKYPLISESSDFP
jgi:hypothetical protein